MLKTRVIEYFAKPKNIAKALGVSRQAVNGWKELIPENHAMILHQLTSGQLIYDPILYGHPLVDNSKNIIEEEKLLLQSHEARVREAKVAIDNARESLNRINEYLYIT